LRLSYGGVKREVLDLFTVDQNRVNEVPFTVIRHTHDAELFSLLFQKKTRSSEKDLRNL
jgi:hypothetical protein